MANDALKIVTHEDVEQAKRPVSRAVSTNPAESIDPAKLMDMLGDIDSLKREIQDRVRRIEAVKQAKSLLVEDAQRTEALNRRLAEIGKVMSAVHSGILDSEQELDDAEVIPMQSREAVAFVEVRPATVTVINESAALPWPKAEENTFAESVSKPLEPELALAAEVRAPELTVAEVVDVPFEISVLEVAASEVDEAAIEAVEEPVGEVIPDAEVIESVAINEPEVLEVVEEAEAASNSLSRVEELVQLAQRVLDESTARLELAAIREEQVASDLQSTQEVMLTTYQSATERLVEAERYWKLADDAALEARGLYDESKAQLALVASKEQQSSAEFYSAQQALTAAYQAACQRLEAAEQYCNDGDGFAQETKKLLEQMQAELAAARQGATTATEDLLSARQELTTAYQFASVAAQRRLDSAEFFRKTTRWVVFSTAFAWMAAVWLAWVAFNKVVPIAIPFAAACLILAGAIFLRRRSAREVEEA
jgi:hypothetical protein